MLQQWLAKPIERRIALVISVLCIVVVIMAVVRFFFFTQPPLIIEATASKIIEKKITPTAAAKETAQIIQPQMIQPPATAHKEAVKKIVTIEHPPLPQGYYVQMGAFNALKRAQAMHQKLKRWKPRIAPRKDLNAIWIGPFASYNLAQQAKIKLKKETTLQGFIVKH